MRSTFTASLSTTINRDKSKTNNLERDNVNIFKKFLSVYEMNFNQRVLHNNIY